MTVYLSRLDDLIVLQAIAEAADGDAVGELTIEVRPGGMALGKSYQEWIATPDGPVQVEPVVA